MADIEMADNGEFLRSIDDVTEDFLVPEDEDVLDEDLDEDGVGDSDAGDEQGLQPGGMYEHFRFVADKGQQLVRIDKFLVLRMEHASRNRIQMAADAGCIWVNGRPVKSNYRIKPLDVVQIVMDRPRHTFEIVAQDIPLDIVLVVNKPAGMVVHPGHGNYDGTLVNALAWHFRNIPGYDASDPRMGLVHRIDKDTSGLLVVAKTPDAKTALGRQFFAKTTRREYVAVVWGVPSPPDGTVDTYIGRNVRDRLQMAVTDAEHGKHAVTHYHTVEDLGYVSVVRCVLETGRTHQIRVHMKHLGHPLFNDARYGGDQILRGLRSASYNHFIANCMEICPRQALHARTLGFVHPVTRQPMFFESPIPDDMSALIQKWRRLSVQKES